MIFWIGLLLLLAGCGSEPGSGIEQVVPDIPENTDFGSLYPHLNALLASDDPDAATAIRDTRAWADERLEGFRDGSCAPAQAVFDDEFTRIYGRTTLGVTMPWMQIYIRNGERSDGAFLWQDASLFVSTVLHEYVHSAQRAWQAAEHFETSGCASARAALTSRRGTWSAGFDALQSGRPLGQGYSSQERTTLYTWASPIARARDEAEASMLTVRWMHAEEQELNSMTVGAANNWAYGVQFLEQLRALAASDCFSPDDATFAEERRIYETEMPQLATELAAHEERMRYFLGRHNLPPSHEPVDSLPVPANPSGRAGIACGLASQLQAPRYPFSENQR
jgi:hypothetical protein